MQNIRIHFIPAVILMMLGLFCRLVAGSIPIPPMSPFSSPETNISAQESSSSQQVTSSVATVSMAKTGKKRGHAAETQSRPWYGLLVLHVGTGEGLYLVGSYPTGYLGPIPSPDLGTNLRPPCC